MKRKGKRRPARGGGPEWDMKDPENLKDPAKLDMRDPETRGRFFANAFLFWRFCRLGPCRRTHSCRGDDIEDCFARNWWTQPETERRFCRDILSGMIEGRTFEAARERADALMRERAASAAAYSGAPPGGGSAGDPEGNARGPGA